MPGSETFPATLAVIILTYNEEANLAQALDSVAGWANEMFVLDSLSADRTLEIARRYDCQIAQNKFENYAKQRNYALDHLPIRCEWVFFWMPTNGCPRRLNRRYPSSSPPCPEKMAFTSTGVRCGWGAGSVEVITRPGC